MSSPERELAWLRKVRDLSHALAEERDLRRLLPRILDAAVELAGAERGFLVRVLGQKPDGGYRFRVEEARGFDRAALAGSAGELSRTVVRRVLERGVRGLVTTSEEDRDVREVSSVQERHVLSIACVPMRLRGEARGVLYLDHRLREGAFSEDDLPHLQAFADHAALALETADLLASQAPAAESASDAGLPAPASLFGPRLRLGALIGGSPAMQALYEQIDRAARTWDLVLIQGESGTGKELVAREVHARGSRPRAPFLSENCAAVAESLLESELFGHARGAFTGATEDRAGLFELAGDGTLFLDEVGDMSLAMQSKLLRVLQEGRVRPVGSGELRPVRCRVLAATHRDLRARVAEGAFREDLYYRLDVLRVQVPPLRERPDDVPALLEHFLERHGGRGLELSPRARRLLASYRWPGNVRELENEVRRLLTLDARRLSARHLSPEIQEGRGVSRAGAAFTGKTLGEVEQAMVEAALRECGGNKARTARQLGIPRSTLYHLLERYGLS